MGIPSATIEQAREALARDEARTRAQQRGTLVVVGGALIAAAAWAALGNGIVLLATGAEVVTGIALIVGGALAMTAAILVIVVGARMRRRVWAKADEPASALDKPNSQFDEAPSKYALPAPSLNHGGSGV